MGVFYYRFTYDPIYARDCRYTFGSSVNCDFHPLYPDKNEGGKPTRFGMVNECHEVGKLGHEVGCVEGR